MSLRAELEAKNKQDLLALVRGIKPSHVDCVYVRQPEALGLGHAVLCAEKLIRDESVCCDLGGRPCWMAKCP
jgi:UTP--glucose-1-phosphate uridylyltransferase